MPTQARPHGWSYKPGSSIVRGYDTSALFREDCLERIKHLQLEVDASMKVLERLKKQHAATEEPIRKLKREFRFTGGRS